MKVRLLVLNNAQKKVEEHLKKFTKNNTQKESEEEYVNRIVHGIEKTYEPEDIIIDLSSQRDETDFYFDMKKVDSIYKLLDNINLMVVNINGIEYDCIFEQDKFDEIIKHLN